jgi:hypothetical protein
MLGIYYVCGGEFFYIRVSLLVQGFLVLLNPSMQTIQPCDVTEH